MERTNSSRKRFARQLKLHVQPDGTIDGWYTNDDAIMRVPVIAGSGKYLWQPCRRARRLAAAR